MDIPPLYSNSDREQILDFLRSQAFGLFVSPGGEYPEASHLPYTIDVEADDWYLYTHMGTANRHKAFLNDSSGHLFIVQGVDHYISSTWYDHENVPTWNYISVHLSGQVEVQEGEAALDNIRRLMNRLESPDTSSRSLDKLDHDMVRREMRGLIAFRLKVQKIEAARKLSQNRDQKNYDHVIFELENIEQAKSSEMANEMRKNYPF